MQYTSRKLIHLKEKALFNQEACEACGACYNGFTPEVEDITLAGPRLCYRATELLLPMLDVRLPVEDLDEVEVAVVGLLEKIKLDAPSLFCTLFIHHSSSNKWFTRVNLYIPFKSLFLGRSNIQNIL